MPVLYLVGFHAGLYIDNSSRRYSEVSIAMNGGIWRCGIRWPEFGQQANEPVKLTLSQFSDYPVGKMTTVARTPELLPKAL